MIYNSLNNRKGDGEMTKRENMKNVSFPIYKDTQDHYLEFKRKHELTHDEAINLLLDKYEEEKENVCK